MSSRATGRRTSLLLCCTLAACQSGQVDSNAAATGSIPASESAAASVRLKVTTQPPTAELQLDGVAIPNPFDQRVPRDARVHVLSAEAAGFATKTTRFRLTRSQSLDLALDAMTQEGQHRPSAPQTPARRKLRGK